MSTAKKQEQGEWSEIGLGRGGGAWINGFWGGLWDCEGKEKPLEGVKKI